MQSKNFLRMASAGLVVALAAAPASAVDLGLAGGGSNNASGLFSSPVGNMGGGFGNSWHGSGASSLPLSTPELPSGGSAPATPATPSIPSLGGYAGGNFAGSLAGALPTGTGAGSVAGDGGVGFDSELDQIVGMTPAAPSLPGLPTLPSSGVGMGGAVSAVGTASGAFTMPAAPALPALPGVPAAPIDVASAVSAAVSGSGSLPSLPGIPTAPEAALPAIPGGIDLDGGFSSTDVLSTEAVSLRVGYGASASGSGLALPALPSLALPASGGSTSEASSGGSMGVSSTIDAAVDVVQGTVAAAGSINGGMAPNSLSIAPTLTAVASGVTIPSLPTFSGAMPALSLPGSSIAVTSDAGAHAQAPSPTNEEPSDPEGDDTEPEDGEQASDTSSDSTDAG